MSENNKWVFIVNPTAGGGFGATMVPRIEREIKHRKLNARLVQTERHGHAKELAHEFLKAGYTHFVAVGGDGTMNEMATPLVGIAGITTGLIPAGTGNDFAQILGYPGRFDDTSWNIFFRQESISLDAGMVNGKYFFNGMGLGFDAQVASENYVAPDEVARGKGKNKYIWHILKTLLFFREKKVTIAYQDKQEQRDCFINTIGNGRRFAGGFFLTPAAIANDGLLDVCMIRKLNLLQRLKILSMVPKGSHISDSRVEYFQSKQILVKFHEKVPYHVDGELYFDTTFAVSVVPAALKIIYHPEGPHYFG